MDTQTKVDKMIANGVITQESLVQSLIAQTEGLRRECKYWAEKGNKPKLRECQEKCKLLNAVLEGARLHR